MPPAGSVSVASIHRVTKGIVRDTFLLRPILLRSVFFLGEDYVRALYFLFREDPPFTENTYTKAGGLIMH